MMNKADVLKVMTVLKAAYPNFYRNVGGEEAEGVVNLWIDMFSGDDSVLVMAAVKTLIALDEKGFPPHIGAIKARMRQLTQPIDMTELEAWALVRRAMCDASMGPESRLFMNGIMDERTSAERNYDALPEIIRRLVGSASQLATWADLKPEDVETVIQSNFMRSYRARSVQERDEKAVSDSVRMLMGGIMKQLEG